MIFRALKNLLDGGDPEEMIRHSYRSYHSSGVNYINLLRTPQLTVKAYLLDVTPDTAVVNPHDHAYNFHTWILDGCLANCIYDETDYGAENYRHLYRPAAGPFESSFEFDRKVKLSLLHARDYGIAANYYMEAEQIHTIRARTSKVAMLLFQYAHREATPDEGTFLYLPDRSIPDTSELYQRFTETEFEKSIETLYAICGS